MDGEVKMSTLNSTQFNLDLILNQIDLDVFAHDNFDISQFPNEIFLLDDISIQLFVAQSSQDINKIKQYLIGYCKATEVQQTFAICISIASIIVDSQNLESSTIYLTTYNLQNNSIVFTAIGSATQSSKANLYTIDIKEVDDFTI